MRERMLAAIAGVCVMIGAGSLPLLAADAGPLLVKAKTSPSAAWKEFPTRTLDALADFKAGAHETALSKYGGRADRKVKATGFFRVEKVNDRWWLVDPEGCLFIHVGVATVNPGKSPAMREALAAKFGAPFFVKPANSGSSVGVSKVRDAAGWAAARTAALRYDRKLLVEEFIQGREIEVAVLGNDDPQASVPGEIVPQHDFYSYEAKYLDENGARLRIPAELPPAISERVRQLAVAAFQVLECAGMARVDFFVCADGRAYVSEINTIPGFTKISMYPKLWEASGVPYPRLIERLLDLAIERHQREQRIETSYRPGD